MEWDRLGPRNFVTPLGLVAGAMLIFLNYEGFELIANASRDVADPERSLPIAYIGGVLIVIYVLIATVQYQAGRRDLLWVEQLQTDQLAVESNVIQLRNAQVANRIQLHLALGGSFDTAPSVAELADGK